MYSLRCLDQGWILLAKLASTMFPMCGSSPTFLSRPTRTLFFHTCLRVCHRLLPTLGYLVGAGQPLSSFLKAQAPSRAGARPGIVMNGKRGPEHGSPAHEYRATMFIKELYKGPHTYDMEEKEYWDALMSYTVELFSDTPDEVESKVEKVRASRRWYALGKYAKAYPFTMEAAAYHMYDDASRDGQARLDQIDESYNAGLIDSDEKEALGDKASARFRAVMALANAFVPIVKIQLMGRKLEFDEMAEMV